METQKIPTDQEVCLALEDVLRRTRIIAEFLKTKRRKSDVIDLVISILRNYEDQIRTPLKSYELSCNYDDSELSTEVAPHMWSKQC